MEERIKKLLSIEYETRLMIMDRENFYAQIYDYVSMLREAGYEVVFYDDPEAFRLLYEKKIRYTADKFALVVQSDIYIPYDIRRSFYSVNIGLVALYPRLNEQVLRSYQDDIALIDFSYEDYYGRKGSESDTLSFLKNQALSKSAVSRYIAYVEGFLLLNAQEAKSGDDWIRMAKGNARLSYYAAAFGLTRDHEKFNKLFEVFLMDGYQKLSSVMSRQYPSILPKTWDLIAGDKIALIVMDGMSMFDYEVFSRVNWPFDYEYYGSFALIPTITSISRQALIAGKYPSQLSNPFSLSKEESGFYEMAAAHGYPKGKAFYGRGYDSDPGPFAKLVTIIVNDIDDMVHGQLQGRTGMYNDVSLLARSGKLQNLIRRLMAYGHTVYITADHGNTECIGTGPLKRTGVETETKSRRMIVLKDFGEASDDLKERTIQYPGYYMDKSYQYYICKGNTSFDSEGRRVMSHGGMTLDEVIVPFIKIKGEKTNG